MRWIHTPLPASEVEAFGRQLGVSPVLAELLLRNGLREADAASRFLHPALAELQDPFLLTNLGAAVARLKQAIERREQLVVLGDYDVDGVSSTAFLVSVLQRFGLNPRFVVPRRLEEGYGLSRGAVDRALEAGRPDLFVALDCGTFRVESRSYGGLVSIAESIGAVTFDGGSQINLIKNGASTITVSMDTLSRAPGSHGTLAIVQELTDALGTGQWAYVRSSAPTVTNGMISPYITSMGSGSKAYFLTITNAVAPYSLDTNVAYGAFNPASSTEIVNIAGAYTMTADDTCWALRHDAVNTTLSMAGKTLTVGSGGLILIRSIISGGTVDVGVAEALICANGNAENNISSVIRGSGGLTMFGLPTCYLALSGNNAALTGGIYVNQGTLTIGNAGALNAVNPNFVNVRANGTLNLAGYNLSVAVPATLTISNTVSRDFAGLIGNSYSALSIVKAGTGTQTLSGASIYTGTTTVSGGTLVVSGTLGLTPVTVKNGATFAGAGWINGGVTVQDGGHIAPGASPGTMNVGSLTLSDASQLDFELGKPDIAGGTNDLLKVNGDLTLDGVLNVTALPGIGTGTYTLMTYRGLIVNNGLTLGPSSPKGGRIEIDPVLKRVNLVLSFERGSLFFVR